MIKKKNTKKLLFLKKNIKKKKNFISSIIQNKETNFKIRQKAKVNFYKIDFKGKKNCLLGISTKYIEKKSKFSRFAIKEINNLSLNQNFIKKN